MFYSEWLKFGVEWRFLCVERRGWLNEVRQGEARNRRWPRTRLRRMRGTKGLRSLLASRKSWLKLRPVPIRINPRDHRRELSSLLVQVFLEA